MDASLRNLADMIITGLRLEDVQPQDIDPAAPLFNGGLGLDSIDALELALLVDRTYGVKIADAESGKSAFASLNALDAFIRARQVIPA